MAVVRNHRGAASRLGFVLAIAAVAPRGGAFAQAPARRDGGPADAPMARLRPPGGQRTVVPPPGDPNVSSRHLVRVTATSGCGAFRALEGQRAELVLLREPSGNVMFATEDRSFLWTYTGQLRGARVEGRTDIHCFACCCDYALAATLQGRGASGTIRHRTSPVCVDELVFQ